MCNWETGRSFTKYESYRCQGEDHTSTYRERGRLWVTIHPIVAGDIGPLDELSVALVDRLDERDDLSFGLQRQVPPQDIVGFVVDKPTRIQKLQMVVRGLRLSLDTIVLLEEKLVDDPSQLLWDACERWSGCPKDWQRAHGYWFASHRFACRSSERSTGRQRRERRM